MRTPNLRCFAPGQRFVDWNSGRGGSILLHRKSNSLSPFNATTILIWSGRRLRVKTGDVEQLSEFLNRRLSERVPTL